MMRLCGAVLWAVVASVVGTAVVPADALTVTHVKIAGGRLRIGGRGAGPGARIAWEGRAAATADARGRFRLTADTLPADCVGEVSDGTTRVRVVSPLCGPRAGAPAPEEGMPPAMSAVVRDANGALVGVVIGGGAHVARRIRPSLVVGFSVSRQGFDQALFGPVFESVDCTGQALLWAEGILPPFVVRGTVAQYAAGAGTPRAIRSHIEFVSARESCWSGRFTPPDRCCIPNNPAFESLVAPVATFDLASLGLVPPFHVEAPPFDGLGSPGPAFLDGPAP